MREQSGSRVVALIRTVLIGYGTAAISALLARSGLQAPVPLGLVAAGVGLQVVLLFARARVARQDGDATARKPVVETLELLGDGITVLLFAIATLGAVTGAAAPL